MIIRNLKESDVDKLRQLVSLCKPLGLHTAFTYWVLAKYFNNTCFVIEDGENLIAYATGVKSTVNPEVLYLWQIGIDFEHRGSGVFGILVDNIIKAAERISCSRIQFSISPDNKASLNAFSKYAKERGLKMEQIDTLEFNDTLEGDREAENIYEIEISK